ncbi:FAD/NAD(P)-binding oxidoreductase [Pseudonocardia xishanensis]|uniref:FAD/NAD(P)-binding oxidoreductase n=1 Tax=Pseudonocardia xishanensis TaxID=630995 RepID=A0ABP8RUM0_9PSEU
MTHLTVGDPSQRVVVAGASTAGLSAARHLRRAGFTGSITLADTEEHAPYRRPEVSKGMLTGKVDRTTAAVRFPDDLGLELLGGTTLVGLDLAARTVRAVSDGAARELPFDGLVIATGTEARPSPYGTVRGAHVLRSLSDAVALRAALTEAQSVVIVGAGFIGLEVAAVLRGLDKEVTVLEAAGVPLERVLGARFGEHLATVHADRGVWLRCGVMVDGVEVGPDGAVTAVRTSDGMRVEADVVLLATGAVPATAWLAGSGLDVADGVRCDATCAVEGAENVVGAGDVASWWNPLYRRRMRVEHWNHALDQGAYAASRLLGLHDPAGFSTAPYFWSDQFGMRIQSIGSTAGHDRAEVVEHHGDRLVVAYGHEGSLVAVAGIQAGTAINGYRRPVLDRVALDAVLLGEPAPVTVR